MKKKTYFIALIPFLVLCLLFELIPMLYTIIRSFFKDGGSGWTISHYVDIFTTPLYQSAIVNSLVISLCSSLIGILIAFLGAKAVYENKGKLSQFFMSVLNMVSNFSGVPLAFSYIIMFGNVGVMTLIGQTYGIEYLSEFPLYSVWGLLLIYVYFQIPLSTLLLIPSFDAIKKEWQEANALLGGNKFVFWFKIGIPVLMTSILSTFSVLFANALAAYASAYALLMNNVSLLPIRLSEQFVGDLFLREEFGSAIAVVLMAMMVLAILIQNRIAIKKGD